MLERKEGRIRLLIGLGVALLMVIAAIIAIPSRGAFAGAPTGNATGGKTTQQASRLQLQGHVAKSNSAKPPTNRELVVLYDQYNNPGANATVDQDFETANDAYDNQGADDFVVPAGNNWNINEVDIDGVYFNGPGPAASFNVYFYTNGGTLPATPVYTATGQSYVQTGTTFAITLSTPAVLGPGTYWVSPQARLDFTPGGEFGWTDRTVTSNSPGAWRNPGNGFATGCTAFTVKLTCIPTASGNDSVFRLMGTNGPTPTGTPPTATNTPPPTNTPTATATVCGNYTVATSSGTIVAGTVDTGNHCDDCATLINLPFQYQLYTTPFNSANVTSNGQLDFLTADANFSNTCLPDVTASYAIFPHWDDLRTDAQTGCSAYTSGCGVFTSVSGTSPNRIFNIEWRAVYFASGAAVNFEVRLYEGQTKFDVIYGVVPDGGISATVGVQRGTGPVVTQYECNTGGLTNGMMLTFTANTAGCPTDTPLPTNTPSPPTHLHQHLSARTRGHSRQFTQSRSWTTVLPVRVTTCTALLVLAITSSSPTLTSTPPQPTPGLPLLLFPQHARSQALSATVHPCSQWTVLTPVVSTSLLCTGTIRVPTPTQHWLPTR